MASEKEEEKEKNKNGEKEKRKRRERLSRRSKERERKTAGMKYCHRSSSLLKLSPSAANSSPSLAF